MDDIEQRRIARARNEVDRVLRCRLFRIVELDRGLLRGYPGNYTDFERRKEGELAAEAVARRKFDKFWREEEAWIRRGIEARRTRNEGRVTRLMRLREERAARRDRVGKVNLSVASGGRSGKLVAELVGGEPPHLDPRPYAVDRR